MKGILHIFAVGWLTLSGLTPTRAVASGLWQAPFDTVESKSRSLDSALSLADVLRLVAAKNPTLRALAHQRQASVGRLRQAGLWSNPELGADIEEVGWDAPGLNESEITVSLTQEFEFFGQRNARKQIARAENDAIHLRTELSEYDLYLETKRRFYRLAHAQERLELSKATVKLAQEIIENINFRIGKGAALQSEIVLAQLEQQRSQMMLDEARQELIANRLILTALWKGEPNEITIYVNREPGFTYLLSQVSSLENEIDSTRGMLQLYRQSDILRAERYLTAAEARPTVTLSGGYKRLEADNSNSLLFGVSLPLPFFNRNQGTLESLTARLRSLNYQIDRTRLEATAGIRVRSIQLRQLTQKHFTLDSLLLPTAEKAYEILKRAYKTGRLPYTQLLEAERSLNELRFEHNDILLAIHEQTMALEGLTGVTLRIDKE